MYFFDTVLLGPLRIALLFFGVLLVHQIITRQPIVNYNLDYIVQRLSIYCASVLVLIFILIQLNMYDIFSLLLVLFVLFTLIYFESKNPLNIIKGINAKRKSFLLNFFKFIERDIRPKKLLENNKHYLYPKKIDLILVTAFGVAFTTFVSRYLFLKNDLYTLSELWIKNLEKIKAFNSGIWFEKGIEVKGELAFINFYAKITSISEEMAIHSFGLIESFSLAVILYWMLKKLVKSKFIAPMIAVLFFAVFYKYLPININLLLEHNPLYFAFCFALPAMIFTVKPKIMKSSGKSFFVALLLLFLGLSLTSFFVYFIILPIFFIPAVLLSTKKTIKYTLQSLYTYFLSLVISLSVYYLAAIKTSASFKEFLISNFVQVNSYSYFPQLIFELEKLIFIYVVLGWVTTGFVFFLWLKNKEKWMPTLVFLMFFNAFILLKDINLMWFDIDLYYQSLAILIVILIGVSVGVLVHFFKLSMPKKPVLRGISLTIFFIFLLVLSYITNGFFKYNSKETEVLKADILKVYDHLSDNYLPYSYAVVNQVYGQSISTNTHHFITYEDFNNSYVKRDSLYESVKNDQLFLKNNPSYILPESVFVFIAKNADEGSKYDIETPKPTIKIIENKLKNLKNKGRNIQIFYQDHYLTVYQIINKDNASKLNDLIF